MKKIISILAVLVLASPAIAAVTLDVEEEDCGTGWVKITYASTGELPRAFALNVSVDAGVIQDVDTSGCEPFDIYMGTIEIVGDQIQWNDPGYTPVAPADAPDDPCQLGDNNIVLEMGSLYDASNPGPNQPAAGGDLIKIQVSDTTATMTVSSNALRGKVVLEDTTSEDCTVVKNLGDICGVCPGDINNDEWVSPSDIGALINWITPFMGPPDYGWRPASELPSGDVNDDEWVSPSDIGALINFITPYMGPPDYGWISCGSF